MEKVEHLLISSAVRAGAPLLNKQGRTLPSDVDSADVSRATDVIQELGRLGLGERATYVWRRCLLNQLHLVPTVSTEGASACML